MIDTAAIIGAIAATLSVASFTPQAWRIIKTREVEGLSVRMYMLTALGFVMWTIFGVLRGEWPIIVPNVLCFVLSGFILAMLLVPKRTREQVAEAAGINQGTQSAAEQPRE